MKPNELCKIASNTAIVSLDLSSDEHYRVMAETLGGEEFMRAHTPQLYALMNATREQHRREGGRNTKPCCN